MHAAPQTLSAIGATCAAATVSEGDVAGPTSARNDGFAIG
jgi:hypothetical protein